MKYAYIHPDEDGNCFRILDQNDLQEFLEDPEGYSGITKFLSQAGLEKDSDPMGWPEGYGVLIKYEVVVPVEKTKSWRIPGE